MTFALSFFLTFLAAWILARLAPRLGLMDIPDTGRKQHGRPIPVVGGLAIWTGMTATYALTGDSFPWPLWVALTGMGLVGLVDDWIELTAFPKLILQILVALFLWFSGTRITLFIPSHSISLLLTLLWFVWVANAMNYMDNSNGLCAGVGAITLAGIALFLCMSGDAVAQHLSHTSFVVVGALAGFLLWNFPRGRIFLGDCGSHLIGAAIAVFLMQTTFTHVSQGQSPWTILAAPLFVIVPLVDFIQVTIDRWRRGQPIWHGDARHLSHRLVAWGLPSSLAVLVLWTATALGIALSLFIWHCFI